MMSMRAAFMGVAMWLTFATGSPAGAQNLTAADVDQIVGQAVAEASAQGASNGAIAVVDRVGNVLGVYVIDPTNSPTMRIDSGHGLSLGNGLEQVVLPAVFGAI